MIRYYSFPLFKLNPFFFAQVLIAASNPTVPLYSFFLNSLLDSVRLNIGECIAASYSTLSVEAATKILMFNSERVSAMPVLTLSTMLY